MLFSSNYLKHLPLPFNIVLKKDSERPILSSFKKYMNMAYIFLEMQLLLLVLFST